MSPLIHHISSDVSLPSSADVVVTAAAVPAGGGRKWLGGVHAADDGKAEPSLAAPRIAEGARKHGVTIHQNCAARGLDITNGRVSGVVTEKGLIRTSAVLCAAGAWASAFLRMQAVSMPQASVRQTALRTGPAPDLGSAVYMPDFAMTRRLDGGYTIAVSGRATLEITPQGIRYVRPFRPMFMKRLRAVEIGIGRSFFEGPDSFRRWHLDRPTPFEPMRVLDPAPDKRMLATIMTRVSPTRPALLVPLRSLSQTPSGSGRPARTCASFRALRLKKGENDRTAKGRAG
jgi:hypothetical protein